MNFKEFKDFHRTRIRYFDPAISHVSVLNALFYKISLESSSEMNGGAAICFVSTDSYITIENSIFSDCRFETGNGGAVYAEISGTKGTATLKSSIFWGNGANFGSSVALEASSVKQEGCEYTSEITYRHNYNYHFYLSSCAESSNVNMSSSNLLNGGFSVYAFNNSKFTDFVLYNQSLPDTGKILNVYNKDYNHGPTFTHFAFVNNVGSHLIHSTFVKGIVFENCIFKNNLLNSITDNETRTDVTFKQCVSDNVTFFKVDVNVDTTGLAYNENPKEFTIVSPNIDIVKENKYNGEQKRLTENNNINKYIVDNALFQDIESDTDGGALSINGPHINVLIKESIFNRVKSVSYEHENQGGAIYVSFYKGEFAMNKSCATNCFAYNNAFAAISYSYKGKIGFSSSCVAACSSFTTCHSTMNLDNIASVEKLNFSNNVADSLLGFAGTVSSSLFESNEGVSLICKLDEGYLKNSNIISNKAPLLFEIQGGLSNCVFVKNECERPFRELFDCSVVECVFDKAPVSLIQEFNLTINEAAVPLALNISGCPIVSISDEINSVESFFKSSGGIAVIAMISLIIIAFIAITVSIVVKRSNKYKFRSTELSSNLINSSTTI